MAEYIDKMEALNKLQGRKTIELIQDIKPSDVIERSKIDKAIKEIENRAFGHPYYEAIFTKDEVLEILKRNIGEDKNNE